MQYFFFFPFFPQFGVLGLKGFEVRGYHFLESQGYQRILHQGDWGIHIHSRIQRGDPQ